MAQSKPKFYGVTRAARILGKNRLTIVSWYRRGLLDGLEYEIDGNGKNGIIVCAKSVNALAAGNYGAAD